MSATAVAPQISALTLVPLPDESSRRRTAEPDGDARWHAVLARDRAADGEFVYAVTSTGIYCRPSCPSRRPRADRVRFFDAAPAARDAGYRACLRCTPERALSPSTSAALRLVARVAALIDAALDADAAPPALQQLARATGTSAAHLQRTVVAELGISPAAYARVRRAERFRARLEAGDTVSQATYAAGFGSGSRVYESDVAGLGLPPGAYRRGAPHVEVRYALVPTPLGRLLVAATDRGVCAVTLGDDDAALERTLRASYPQARLAPADRRFATWVQRIAEQVTNPRSRAIDAGDVIPTDVRATAFQQRVWRALREIPVGETRSYAAVAAGIGAPTATRAVASACARNPVALLVPCHRVVRSDGAVGGYRWGIDRKRALLAAERGDPEIAGTAVQRRRR